MTSFTCMYRLNKNAFYYYFFRIFFCNAPWGNLGEKAFQYSLYCVYVNKVTCTLIIPSCKNGMLFLSERNENYD